MTNPKVSVIIPCYNQGSYLEEAVDSILDQTFQDFEIIVVNDGSTDEFTNKLLKNYKKEKTTVYTTKNQGLAATRNFAIEKAKGTYILPLDADDMVARTYLEKAVKILDSNSKIGFVTPWAQLFESENAVWKTKKLDLKTSLTENTTAVASVFRKECWEKVGGYDLNMIGYQDWDFWISISKLGYEDSVIEEPLFYYRIRKNSMLSNSNKNRISLISYMAKKHSDILHEHSKDIILKMEKDLIYLRESLKINTDEISRLNSLLKENEDKYNQKDKILLSQQEDLKSRNDIILQQLNYLKEKDLSITSKLQDLEKLNQTLAEVTHKSKFEIKSFEKELSIKDLIISDLEKGIRERDEHIYHQNTLLEEKDNLIQIHKNQLEEKNSAIENLESLKNFKPLRLRNIFIYDKWSFKKILKLIYLSISIITPEPLRRLLRPYAIKLRYFKNSTKEPKAPKTPKTSFTIEQKEWSPAKPLISIVIPCFNYGKYIEETIDSILEQTFQDFEIIVVEGGSTDGITPEVLANLNKPKTIVHFREGRHLVGDNRNSGISKAQGKYICCIDADDKIKPTYLEKALFYLENYNYDIVSTSVHKFGESDDIYYVSPNPNLEHVINFNGITTVAIFKKDFWKKASGYHDYGLGKEHVPEDWDLWVRMLGCGARVINIHEPLMLYRVHGVSLSTDPTNPTYEEQAKVIKMYNEKYISPKKISESNYKNSLNFKVNHGLINLKNRITAHDKDNRVLFALPFAVLGGADKRVFQLSELMYKNNIKPVIFTTIPFDDVIDGSTIARYEQITNEIYHLPRFLEDDEKRKEFVFYYLESRNIESIVLVGSEFFYGLLPEIKERFPHIQIIDLQFNTVGHFENNRRYADFIDYTVAENLEVKNKILDEYNEDPEKVVQILSGVDTKVYSKASFKKVLPHGIPKNKKIILYLGRLSEEKGPDVFIKIAHRLKNDPSLFFILAGIGPMQEECNKLIEELNIKDNILLPGMVNSMEYLPITDILLLPSRIDGRPYTILEALSMSIPVIASNVGGLPDIITHGQNGILCESENIEEFAKWTVKLFSDKKLYDALSKSSREYAVKNFDIEIENSTYLRLFIRDQS